MLGRAASAAGTFALSAALALTMTPAAALTGMGEAFAPAGEAFAATTSTLEGSAATAATNRVSQDVALTPTQDSARPSTAAELPITRGIYSLDTNATESVANESISLYAGVTYNDDPSLDWVTEGVGSSPVFHRLKQDAYDYKYVNSNKYPASMDDGAVFEDIAGKTPSAGHPDGDVNTAGSFSGNTNIMGDPWWAGKYVKATAFANGLLLRAYTSSADLTLLGTTRSVHFTTNPYPIVGFLIDDTYVPIGFPKNVQLTSTTQVYPVYCGTSHKTVTVNKGDGTSNATFECYATGNPVASTFPANPTYGSSGAYRFVEWNTKADGTGTPVTSNSNFKDISTIYAVWEYDITYHYVTDDGEQTSSPETFIKGRSSSILANPSTRTGYNAVGWKFGTWPGSSADVAYKINGTGASATCAGPTGNLNGEAAATANVDLYLFQQPNTYTVWFYPNNPEQSNDTVKVSQVQTYNDSSTVLAAFDSSKFKYFGHHFTGKWNTKPDGTGESLNDKASGALNLTTENGGTYHLYAQWEQDTWYIEFDSNGATGTMEKQTLKFDENKAINKNKFSNKSYTFQHWTVKDNPSAGAFNDQADPSQLCPGNGGTVTLVADWGDPAQYSITYKGVIHYAGGASEDDADTRWYANTTDYPRNYTVTTSDITYPADVARGGYTFQGWTIILNDDSSGLLDAGAAEAAKGTPTKNLTVNPGNGTNGDGATGTYGDITVTAHWSADVSTITYHSNFGNFGEYTSSHGLTADDTAYSVPASGTTELVIDWVPPKEYWYATSTFVGWNVTGDGIDDYIAAGTNGTKAVKVTIGEDAYNKDIVCTAIWKHVQVSIEAPVTVNFCASSASDAYDVTNPNERVWLESEAVFKSYLGETGSSHDFAIASVECRDVAKLEGDAAKTPGASGLLVTDGQVQKKDKDGNPLYKDAAGNETIDAQTGGTDNAPIMVPGEEVPATDAEMFWIANKSTVSANGGTGSPADRHYFGYGSDNNVIKSSWADGKSDFGEKELRVYLNEGGNSQLKTQAVMGDDGQPARDDEGNPIELKWRETTLYYGLDLTKCRISTKAVEGELKDGVYKDYELVRLVFTFAPIAD